MIETYSELKSWFFCHKVPKGINELAFKAWEDALTDPSLGKIWKYYVLIGMTTDESFAWGSIAESYS